MWVYIYKNDIEKYVNMKMKDITKNSMNKLNKHLMNLHSNLDNIILDDYLKKIKDSANYIMEFDLKNNAFNLIDKRINKILKNKF